VPFTDIGAAVMEMLAKTQGIEIAPADKKELTQAFSEMPPYAEVPGALDRLRAIGDRAAVSARRSRLTALPQQGTKSQSRSQFGQSY
jgi:hypothetical protein